MKDFMNHPKVRHARQLLLEAERETIQQEIIDRNRDVCKCGHDRSDHGPSYSINYTGGVCRRIDACECMHFVKKG